MFCIAITLAAACDGDADRAAKIEKLEAEVSSLRAEVQRLRDDKQASEPAPRDPIAPDAVELAIAASGQVSRDGEPLDDAALRELFARLAADDTATPISIAADPDAEHGRMVGVMDLARQAGLHRLAIASPDTSRSRRSEAATAE